jgi:WXG100 family type VII secretion target
MPDEILYHNAMLPQLSADIVSQAATLQELIDDTVNQINLLAEGYKGQAPDAVRDGLVQFMSTTQDIRDTMQAHGATVRSVHADMMAADASAAAGVGST